MTHKPSPKRENPADSHSFNCRKNPKACQHFNCKPDSWIIKWERQQSAYGCLFISPYGAELCTAFLHLHRHPGRHQNALLILAAPRHKSASGKTEPKMHRENTRAATAWAVLRFSTKTATELLSKEDTFSEWGQKWIYDVLFLKM